MTAGRKTFSGQSDAGTIAAILERQPEPLSKRQPLTPLALDRLVTRCLAKDPEDRYQSARDAFLELRGTGSAEVPRSPARRAAWRRRRGRDRRGAPRRRGWLRRVEVEPRRPRLRTLRCCG